MPFVGADVSPTRRVGLYRTTVPLVIRGEPAIPADVLVFVGKRQTDDLWFAVRPRSNRLNRWYWDEPTIALGPANDAWVDSLVPLPQEGYYTLPETLELPGGARWLRNAIVQLGYDETGRGIIFVAEQRSGAGENALFFSDRGVRVADELLGRLSWAPILPVEAPAASVPPRRTPVN